MPRGPAISPTVRERIAKVHYDHSDWTAKEVHNEVKALLGKERLSLKPDWPGLSAVQKELHRLRKAPNPQDKPWNMLTLSEYKLPPEALPAVLQAWVHTRLNSSHPFTVRQAKWVSLLHCVIKDISKLAKVAMFYAELEYFREHYGPRHSFSLADHELFEIVTGQKLSEEQIDKLLDEPQRLFKKYIEKKDYKKDLSPTEKREAKRKGLMENIEGISNKKGELEGNQ